MTIHHPVDYDKRPWATTPEEIARRRAIEQAAWEDCEAIYADCLATDGDMAAALRRAEREREYRPASTADQRAMLAALIDAINPKPERPPIWGRIVWALIFGGPVALGLAFAAGIAVLVWRLF